MSCTHPRDENAPDGLPCPWPGCPDGTPQESVALMSGTEGVLRLQKPYRREIESDGGVALFRRRREGDGWRWVQLAETDEGG